LAQPSIQPDHSVALASPPVVENTAGGADSLLKPLPAAKKPSP